MTFYHNEEYADTDMDMEVATAIDGAVLESAPVDDALIFRAVPGCDLAAALIFEGAFEDVVAPIQSLLRWIGLHKHVPAGPLRELHLSGPAHKNEAPDSINVIELQVPIAPIAGR